VVASSRVRSRAPDASATDENAFSSPSAKAALSASAFNRAVVYRVRERRAWTEAVTTGMRMKDSFVLAKPA
jgi:hypothetical protein